jgi:hypothetical protein
MASAGLVRPAKAEDIAAMMELRLSLRESELRACRASAMTASAKRIRL